MRVEDYFPARHRWWFRLHEKRSKQHDVPAHHTARADLEAYLKAADICCRREGPVVSRDWPASVS